MFMFIPQIPLRKEKGGKASVMTHPSNPRAGEVEERKLEVPGQPRPQEILSQ